MAKDRTKRLRRGRAPESMTGPLGTAFEDIDLPGSMPPSAEEPTASPYEDVELELATAGIRQPAPSLLAAKEELEQRLILGATEEAISAESGTDAHGFENIVGVGISEKITGSSLTNEQCVTVYVVAKAPEAAVTPEAMVPAEINGIPTDVVATGEFLAQPYRGRYRPAPSGVSVGHYKITAGTIGCLVRHERQLFILSNNHVLANVNAGKPGDPILQPGPYDGGHVPRDVIAVLSKFIPVKFGGAPNQVDCAIARTKPSLVSPKNISYGTINPNPAPCRLNLMVKKAGRTTQFTRGRITDCNATVRVGYGTAGVAIFQNQIIIQCILPPPAQFSAGGDSGSLIVTDVGNRPVGLLFAGSSTHTIANPISAVLSALGVTIVP